MTITREAPLAPVPGAAHAGPPRVALYSHDALGLGHIRRNLALAHALAGSAEAPDILLLTSAPEVVAGDRPDRCDVVALPGVAKSADGTYTSRHLSLDRGHLGRMREGILSAALDAFRPDVLIVDKHARGLSGELEPALEMLAAHGTRVVLGIRDVLDDPLVTRQEWLADRTRDALARWYHQVWVYGDRRLHDPLAHLPIPRHIAKNVIYTGYLAHGRGSSGCRPAKRPYVLAAFGGGADGFTVADAFVRSELPHGYDGILLAGPQMPPEQVRDLERIAAQRTDMRVVASVDDAAGLVAGAAALVGMGGYNTVCEAIAARTPMLVIPRVVPRREQLVRASVMSEAGLIDMLLPESLSPEAISAWLRMSTLRADRPTPASVDLDGLRRIPGLVEGLVASRRKDVAHAHL